MDTPERGSRLGQNDPNAEGVSNMLPVPLPEGVILDIREMRNDEPFHQFGADWMLHGVINIQRTGKSSHSKAEGTVLSYSGNDYQTGVARRALTAEDINRIGRLSREVEELAILFNFLSREIDASKKTMQRMEVFKKRFPDALKNSQFNPSEMLSEMGIRVAQMESSKEENRERWRGAISEFGSLGVETLMTTGGEFGSLPIGEMAEGFTAEKNAKVNS